MMSLPSSYYSTTRPASASSSRAPSRPTTPGRSARDETALERYHNSNHDDNKDNSNNQIDNNDDNDNDSHNNTNANNDIK